MSVQTPRRAARAEPRPPTRARRRRSGGVAGVLGEILITLGVLIGLFVIWQVYWTDVVGERAATEHIAQWEVELPEAPSAVGEPRYDEPPLETPLASGGQLGTMYVPAWGEDWRFPIGAGVDYQSVLDNGFVGHFSETALPGQIGNVALAGHRQSYGRPFYDIETLGEDDAVIVRTRQAWYVYRVTDEVIITPDQVDVLLPVPFEPDEQPTERVISLVTCHPLWSVAQRYVVHGELEYWVDPSTGYPPDLPEGSY